MHRDAIERYLREVGRHLNEAGLTGEILILGGAYMTLVLRQREATKDVDSLTSLRTPPRFGRQRLESPKSMGFRATGSTTL